MEELTNKFLTDMSFGNAYIIVGSILGVLFAIVFAFFFMRTLKFYFKPQTRKGEKILSGIAVISSILLGITCIDLWRVASCLCLYALMIIVGVEVIFFLLRRIVSRNETARQKLKKICHSGLIPVGLFVGIVVYSVTNMNHVVRLDYTVSTEKNIRAEGYTIAYVSDVHYEYAQRTEVLKDVADEINAICPDVFILGGDIVEEATSNAGMHEVFEILGGIQTKYGIYYNYGNHDRQPYASKRSFTDEELEMAIRESGITILQDEYVIINDEILLVGREDIGWGNEAEVNRESIADILAGESQEYFIINSDHQPVDMENVAQAGGDVQLSGHTHAGQVFPMNVALKLLNVSPVFGLYEYGDMKLYISAGEAGGNYPIRTEGHCDYEIFRIEKK